MRKRQNSHDCRLWTAAGQSETGYNSLPAAATTLVMSCRSGVMPCTAIAARNVAVAVGELSVTNTGSTAVYYAWQRLGRAAPANLGALLGATTAAAQSQLASDDGKPGVSRRCDDSDAALRQQPPPGFLLLPPMRGAILPGEVVPFRQD